MVRVLHAATSSLTPCPCGWLQAACGGGDFSQQYGSPLTSGWNDKNCSIAHLYICRQLSECPLPVACERQLRPSRALGSWRRHRSN